MRHASPPSAPAGSVPHPNAPPSRRLTVRLRGGAYHLARYPDTGVQHAPDCGFFEPKPGTSGVEAYGPEARSTSPDGGDVRVRLTFGRRVAEPGTDAAGEALPRWATGKEQRGGLPRMTPLGLLHELWELAGLTFWPGGGPPARTHALGQARHALIEVAGAITWGDGSLVERLSVVIPGGAVARDAEVAETARVLAAPRTAHEHVVAISLWSGAVPSRFDGGLALVRLAQGGTDYHFRLQTSPDLVDGWLRRFDTALRLGMREGVRVAALLVCEPPLEDRAGRAAWRVVTGGLMARTSQLVPVDSASELELANYLVRSGRRFRRPLRFDAGRDAVMPDFVLHDVAGRGEVPLEVFGMATEAYAARRAEEAHYTATYGPGRWWRWVAASADPREAEPLATALARLPRPGPPEPDRPHRRPDILTG